MTDNQTEARLQRARGCLLGQLAGDSLGSLVEFKHPRDIRREYPDGVRDLADGGTWDTLAGQPTDDSELALTLARLLVKRGQYNPVEAKGAYLSWLDSNPFDCGTTTVNGLHYQPDLDSQSNGALMRISPLGIFGAGCDPARVAAWARQDAAITHPNKVCQQANVLFVTALACAIRTGCEARELYRQIKIWAEDMRTEESLLKAVNDAANLPPSDYVHREGWVLIAFQNALWQLLHASSLEDGVIDTVARGGDTDTNAAICGALLGAVYGQEAVPKRWVDKLLSCRPEAGNPRVRRPRPERFWPVDALDLADSLLAAARPLVVR